MSREFGLRVSEKKTEAMHLWFRPSTASNALRIEAVGQRYKQTTEFVYLDGAISESADLDTEIERRIGAAWASVRKYSCSQLHDRQNTRLSLKIRLFKVEVMEAMLYGCATWTMRSQEFSNLRTFYHKLLLRIIGFQRKDRTGYKPLSYGEVLERTGSDRIKTTFRKRQLGFAGALVWQGDSKLSKRVMFGRLTVQAPSEKVDRRRLGGLPPEKSRGLRGGPAQRQRTEVDHTRSCYQGSTGLDDCCEEREHLAPGGREGSGSTR